MTKKISFIVLLCCFILTALGFYLGMAKSPDSYAYINIAKQMLQGEYFSLSTPLSYFRMFGYPYVLYIFMNLFGDDYANYILFLQVSFFLLSINLGYMYLKGKSKLIYLNVYSIIVVSMTVVWMSFCFLTDSFANSFVFISISIVISQFKNKEVKYYLILIAGVCWLIAFLLRESILFLSLTPIFILFFRQFIYKENFWKHLIMCGVFMAPIFTGYYIIAQINQLRTGHFYITTGSQTVMLQSLEKVAQKNQGVFDSDTDLDRLARETYKNFTFAETRAINGKLKEIGYSSHEIVKIVGQKYKETWQEYPLDMLEKTWNELRIDRVIFGTFAPWRAFRRYWIWRYQEDIRQEIPDFADKVLKTVSSILSASIMLPFMIYLLISAGKFCLRRQMTFSEKSSLIYGCAYFGFLMPFAMSHSELRYVWGASLLPLAVFCFAWKDWMPLFSKYVSSFFFRRKSEI